MGTPKVWLVLAVAVAACGGDPNPDPTDFSCATNPDPHCDHPIDRILVPKLRELGVPIRDASAEELCRRMAIDLLGRGPTQDELATCRGQTSGEMFDAFVAKPEYVREQRRAWGELFKYDNANVRPEEILDLDRLVGELYAETLDYAEFATQVVMHPALEALHPADSWTTYIWNLYLGRPARQDEVEAMRPLTFPWGARAVCDGAIWWNFYKMAIDRGATEVDATTEGNQTCWNVAKVEYGYNLCNCRPGFFSDGCVSDALGRRIEVTPACPNPNNYGDPANFMRASDRTPGDGTCPDGTTRVECNDRLIDYTTQYAFLPFVEWDVATPSLVMELRGIGDALVARGDFWETAADRELHRLLGWWQATFRHPDSDLPAVRTILAEELRTSGSARAVQRRIVTSLLYGQPAAAPEVIAVEAMAPWVAGPTKLLAGESWLVTAAAAVGESAGTCDFRAVSVGYYAPFWTDGRLLEQYTGTLDDLTYPGYSVNSIVRLAGCNTDAKRPEVSNIGLTFNQADISRTLCAYGQGVTPPGFTTDFTAAGRHLVERLWHRAPVAGEVEAMATDMAACVAAGGTTACEDSEAAVRWMCQRMIDSAEFATY